MDWLPHSVHLTLWLIFLARASTVRAFFNSSSLAITEKITQPEIARSPSHYKFRWHTPNHVTNQETEADSPRHFVKHVVCKKGKTPYTTQCQFQKEKAHMQPGSP